MASVRTRFDVSALAQALKRPGADPRLWISWALVEDVGFDPEHGVFVDVQLLPEGTRETCLLGAEYAGDDFGMYAPVDAGDLVLVAVPDGDPGHGPVLIKRVWHASAPPPAELGDPGTPNPTDAARHPTLVVRKTSTLRVVARDGAGVRLELSGTGKLEVVASGGAEVSVKSDGVVRIDSPDVRLGDSAGQAVARVGDIVAVTVPPLVAGVTPVTPLPPVAPTATGGTPAVGQIVSGKATVKA